MSISLRFRDATVPFVLSPPASAALNGEHDCDDRDDDDRLPHASSLLASMVATRVRRS